MVVLGRFLYFIYPAIIETTATVRLSRTTNAYTILQLIITIIAVM